MNRRARRSADLARTLHPVVTESQAGYFCVARVVTILSRPSVSREGNLRMTQRKPKGMSFTSWIDQLISSAREAGDFDDLPGRGEPLENLDSVQDPLWWAKGLVRREGIDATPPAIEIRRKVEKLRSAMAEIPSEADLGAAVEALNNEIRHLNKYAHRGPPTTQAPLDLETELERWRELREGKR